MMKSKQWWLDLADVVDALRIFPRVILSAFFILAVQALQAAMAASNPQDYVGNGAAALAIAAFTKAYDYYVKSGGNRP